MRKSSSSDEKKSRKCANRWKPSYCWCRGSRAHAVAVASCSAVEFAVRLNASTALWGWSGHADGEERSSPMAPNSCMPMTAYTNRTSKSVNVTEPSADTDDASVSTRTRSRRERCMTLNRRAMRSALAAWTPASVLTERSAMLATTTTKSKTSHQSLYSGFPQPWAVSRMSSSTVKMAKNTVLVVSSAAAAVASIGLWVNAIASALRTTSVVAIKSNHRLSLTSLPAAWCVVSHTDVPQSRVRHRHKQHPRDRATQAAADSGQQSRAHRHVVMATVRPAKKGTGKQQSTVPGQRTRAHSSLRRGSTSAPRWAR
mmetsp:Transcript_7887/g.31151  ORF Transcript_7887/g.31151 Transcript_7887/m.31151 type:complete len:313 (-) Transcript_7887:111-1049(-)